MVKNNNNNNNNNNNKNPIILTNQQLHRFLPIFHNFYRIHLSQEASLWYHGTMDYSLAGYSPWGHKELDTTEVKELIAPTTTAVD